MYEINPPFKKPPKKHEPRGLSIIYEDKFFIVVKKANGLLTIGTDKERNKTAQSLMSEYVKRGNAKSPARVFIVHRLDRDTSGVLIFAKDERTKNNLQENWGDYSKKYLTVVNGTMEEKEGTITSLLAENKAHIVYTTEDEDEGKLAQTEYKVLKENAEYSLLEINLLTGRKNQIRVHMAEAGHPVAGDIVYGKGFKRIKRLALHAVSLSIIHPVSKRKLTFETEMPNYFKELIKI